MRQMQDKIRQQEEAIEKLSTPAAPPVPTPVPAPPAARDREQLKQEVREEVLRDIQPQLAAASKTFPSQFNPAIGLVIDNVFSYRDHDRANFDFRTAELGIAASIDPFARGYALISGSPNGLEVEEAALVTTSLPYNLTVKGGRFFADFGRLAHFHDDALPVVNRPIVLDRFIGGESRANGIEVNYILPIEQYVALTAGMYNKLGAENDRVSDTVPRGLGEFTYLGHAVTFINLSDDHSVDVGVNPGFLFDYAQDIDRAVGATKAYSPYLTFWPSEFHRLRLQYTYLDAPDTHENQFFLQWTAILGSHIHGFRDR